MRSGLHLLLLFPLSAILACSSGPTTPTGGSGNAPVTGNYLFTISPAASGATTFTGSLSVSGTSVSGVFQYFNPGTLCAPGSPDIPFTGVISNSVMTLTSGSFSGSVATLTIQLPLTTTTAGTIVASGTAVIAGGTCALASSPTVAAYVPSFTGTFGGTLAGPVTGTVSLGLTQSTANADGKFPINASVTFTAPTCSFSLSGITGLASGYNIQLGAGSSAPNNQISMNVATSTTPGTLSLTVLSGLPCANGSYTGSITRQ